MHRAAGVIIGLCLLQGGPDLRLFSPKFLDALVGADDLQTPVGQFASGLCVTGILQLLRAFSQCWNLMLAAPPTNIDMRQLLSMFRKNYSEHGSNSRQREEAIASIFIKYLREVSAGERVVTFPDILQFITCLASPPPLGFQPVPVITFQPSTSFLPKAQTCTNTLILPIARLGENLPSADYIYQKFDLGFKNKYFGVG